MRRLGVWVGGLIIAGGLYGVAVAATPDELPADAVCHQASGFTEEEVWVCVAATTTTLPPTTTTLPPTTTTTLPPTTTTTLPPTTTTTLPPTTTTTLPPTTTTTLPPFEPDACVLDQIDREPFKANGTPKTAFDIFTANVDTGQQWFEVSYTVDLGNGYGWISGDKSGYQGAYMFLVELDTGRVVGRAYFAQVDGAAYTKINDRFMDEIQTTHLGFDGTCATPAEDNQGQVPGALEDYTPNSDPDERPVVEFVADGQVIEVRPYNLVSLNLPTTTKFRDGGLSGPLTQRNGFGTDPHTVYQRQTVLLDVKIDDVWNPAVVIYYDTLVPDVTLEVSLP